mmetsp:Transcript_23232/g.45078  ORF Transcript_23232/g.45078 Transcript_23232/m.45078 type:complete len:499 (-) Transcript_23232:132-1628(-)|eukprot:CAMPEP_0173396654 /NCGR_PEP_ID=MMETSP1356-20130122/36107_1 /TAXON_ID=77927 ORGANISM="Hemiselmis virescens, Strain PCC157" /NCGR_SAMPLE_ID=MMETSP1356 /ASSEMBLY_ACC=CAM_ASM_000847 /LENGTH=498 /DNA_ID=CAMNT_0014355737 /DNA_START=250 /DNA_END=1746 /DNA_ORIENTATION=+
MTVTYETPSASSCLKLPSFLEAERESMFEGASILGSLRGSAESAPGIARVDSGSASSSQQRTEDLMSAPSFLLTALAPRTPMGGSNDALHCFVGGSSFHTNMSASRLVGFAAHSASRATSLDEDHVADLPQFPRRANSNRPKRASSLTRGADGAGSFTSTSGRAFPSFPDSSLGIFGRLHSASRSGSCESLREAPAWGSRSVSRDNFLDLVAAEPSPLQQLTAAATVAIVEQRLGEHLQQQQPHADADAAPPAAAAAAAEPPHEDEAPTQRPHRAAAARAASRVAEAEAEAESEESEEDARAVKKKPTARAAVAASRKRQREEAVGRSGLHVRDRPDMQKKARDGQEHWLTQVKAVRRRWEERREWESEPRYRAQVETCAAQQIKSQHECLLRTLQMAATDGLIEPLPFAECGPDSFLGWTGFRVVMKHAQDFRSRIDALFPVPLKENTLHTSFRRAGLVPDKWSSGWLGLTPFKYSNDKRVAYAPTPAAAAAARGGA